uniref:Uncharacterized protein n=1 Tax=Quercus lobata TaxID=97700 RepID=A0A7N2LT62_QUELO
MHQGLLVRFTEYRYDRSYLSPFFAKITINVISAKSGNQMELSVELKEEVKHHKSMLEQQAIQMIEQRRHFEEQQASQMAAQRAHCDNMMMQMLSCITSQSAQSSSDH